MEARRIEDLAPVARAVQTIVERKRESQTLVEQLQRANDEQAAELRRQLAFKERLRDMRDAAVAQLSRNGIYLDLNTETLQQEIARLCAALVTERQKLGALTLENARWRASAESNAKTSAPENATKATSPERFRCTGACVMCDRRA